MIKERIEKGEKVRLRLSGAASDLHAADGQYHRDCYQDFINPQHVASTVPKGLVSNSEVEKDLAISNVVDEMDKNQSGIWTFVDLHQLYLGLSSVPQSPLSRRLLVSNINDHFGRLSWKCKSKAVQDYSVSANMLLINCVRCKMKMIV